MGYDVYSNYPLGFKHTFITSIKEAQTVRSGYLLFDEFWEWVHSRTSQTTINKKMMEICLLNRKRGVSIIYNTQLPRTVDVILREVTNFRYLPHMVKHEDDQKYVHYIIRDIIDRESCEMVVPIPIKELGKLFSTYYEVKKLSESIDYTPLEKGIGLEKDFIKAVRKVKGVRYVDLLPNSGSGSSWLFDVIVWGSKRVFAFDVKGVSKTHVYLKTFGKDLLKKIDNARDHNAVPYLSFPNNKFIRLGIPGAWYVHKLTENSYLKRLNADPRYDKLVKNSVRLQKIHFDKE